MVIIDDAKYAFADVGENPAQNEDILKSAVAFNFAVTYREQMKSRTKYLQERMEDCSVGTKADFKKQEGICNELEKKKDKQIKDCAAMIAKYGGRWWGSNSDTE